MQQPGQIASEVINEGLSGITDYVMPIVAVLAIMLIFGVRVVLFNGTRTKNYLFYVVVITFVLIATGIVLTHINEEIAEPVISGISTIIFVLFVIQVIIQIKLKRNK